MRWDMVNRDFKECSDQDWCQKSPRIFQGTWLWQLSPNTLGAEQWACTSYHWNKIWKNQILRHPLIFSCATRYNKPCSDACESRGESYYWCNTGSTWDYCSPAGNILLPIILTLFRHIRSHFFSMLSCQLCHFSWDREAGYRRRRWAMCRKVS